MTSIAACFGLAMASAVLPWLNGEIVLLAFVAHVTAAADVAWLVGAATAGQVSGKSALYWMARRTPHSPDGRVGLAVARWRRTCTDRPRSVLTTMMVSATFGLPPFYLTTLVAGALQIRFIRFLQIAVCGRLLHFGVVALAPTLGRALFR